MKSNLRTRTKICGITRAEDGLWAAQLGVDAIGLVFYPASPRYVTKELAQEIVHQLPPFVTTVGLFVDASRDEVEQVLDVVPLDLLQFHGAERPDYCGSFGRNYIKAVRMGPQIDLHDYAARYFTAAGLLLDAYSPLAPGGTGEQFDWRRIPTDIDTPIILAGGLSSANISQALQQSRPYGVDVSSGVEVAKGIKDQGKMSEFIQRVGEFDAR